MDSDLIKNSSRYKWTPNNVCNFKWILMDRGFCLKYLVYMLDVYGICFTNDLSIIKQMKKL